MAGRVAIPDDYAELDALWAIALQSTRGNWPTTVGAEPPLWGMYRCYVSPEVGPIHFGLATMSEPRLLQNNDHPDGLVLAERAHLYIGPRAAAGYIAALGDVLDIWTAEAAIRGDGALFGIVPNNWGRFGPYMSRGWKKTRLDDDDVILFILLGDSGLTVPRVR